MRICINCGTIEHNIYFKNCIECGGTFNVSPAPHEQQQPLASNHSELVKVDSSNYLPEQPTKSQYSQLAFYGVYPDCDENIPIIRVRDVMNHPNHVWPPDAIPTQPENIEEFRRLQVRPQKNNKSPGENKARICKPMTRKQQIYLKAILLALLFGWCGLHRKYIGDHESFKVFFAFGVVGGFLTAGVTTVMSQVAAVYDACLLLTGRIEIDETLMRQKIRLPETVFTQSEKIA